MKNASKLIAGTFALFALAACGGGSGYVSASAGGPMYYDGFYDGHYGPFYDGYWGDDSFFYYSGGRGRPFARDEEHHFRRDGAPGFNSFHHPHMGPHTGHAHEPAHS